VVKILTRLDLERNWAFFKGLPRVQRSWRCAWNTNIYYLEKKNHIAKISLNMPETKNALNLEVREDLLEILTALRDDDSVRVVILTGTGADFCAGGDIGTMKDVTPVAGRIRLKKGQRLIKTMVELEKPIIAAINGVAAGAGVSLALASDILIASETASICHILHPGRSYPGLGVNTIFSRFA